MSSILPPVNRLLLLAPPGEGKTSLLREIVRRNRMGGTLLDPLNRNDFGDVLGVRWEHVTRWPFAPDFQGPPADGDEEGWTDYNAYVEALEDVQPGEMLVADEAYRYVPSACSPKNAMLQWLDTARNGGRRFVLAEKRPARLSALVSDLATHFCFRPTLTPSGRQWLQGAGVDIDLARPLPNLAPSLDNPWYLLGKGGELVRVSAREILDGILTEGDPHS